MKNIDYAQISDAVRDAARLKTLPLSIKFMKRHENFPEKTKRPATDLGKRVTIYQPEFPPIYKETAETLKLF